MSVCPVRDSEDVVVRSIDIKEIESLSMRDGGRWCSLNRVFSCPSETHHVIGAFIGNDPIGFMHSTISVETDRDEVRFFWELCMVYVEPNFQKNGVASRFCQPIAERVIKELVTVSHDAYSRGLAVNFMPRVELLSNGGAAIYENVLTLMDSMKTSKRLAPVEVRLLSQKIELHSPES